MRAFAASSDVADTARTSIWPETRSLSPPKYGTPRDGRSATIKQAYGELLTISSWSEKFLPEITPVMSGPMVSEFWREAANAEERVDIIIYP
jgi:hypothetical protein